MRSDLVRRSKRSATSKRSEAATERAKPDVERREAQQALDEALARKAEAPLVPDDGMPGALADTIWALTLTEHVIGTARRDRPT